MKNDKFQELVLETQKKQKGFLYRVPYYPLLLGLYSVLYLWQENFVQVPTFVIQRPLMVALGLTGIVTLLASLLMWSVRKGAALAGLILGLFFNYGHSYNLVEGWRIFNILIGRHINMLILWGLLIIVGAIWIWYTDSDLLNLTWALNFATGFLILLSVIQLGYLSLTDPLNAAQIQDPSSTSQVASNTQPSNMSTPDIYYFLLDAYGREDLLLEDIQLDNNEFISELEELGFIVPDCTLSNYNHTIFSMVSALNMNYLDEFGFSSANLANMDKATYTTQLKPLILDNEVLQKFKGLDYKIITLKTRYPYLNYPYSDIEYDYQEASGSLQRIESFQFYLLYLRTTLMRVVVEATEVSPERLRSLPSNILRLINPEFIRFNNLFYYQTAQQNLFHLDQLEEVAQVRGKKFLYAHLMVTHPPFTFTATGDLNFITNDSKEGYRDQIIYANQRMITILQNILSQSDTPPIIILQADHGFGKEGKGEEQFKILNAYYLPETDQELIYPQITPVNTFRLIFSYFFDQDYPLLPDQSILISPDNSDGYRIIPQSCVQPSVND